MRIMITGAAGFIGSHLADRLLAEGHRVLGLDNFETGRLENLPENSEFEFENRDISHDLYPCFSYFGPELVIHCAASYKNPDDWARDAKTNCLGTANVTQQCKKFEVKKLIYFQTSLCYGVDPYEKRKAYPVTTDHPLNPAPNSYAITKTAGEQIITLSGVLFVSLRLANIYGPRNLTGAIPTFYKKLTTGEHTVISDTRRDFVYIDDLINLVIKIINEPESQGVYHVSTESDISIPDLYYQMRSLLNKPINSFETGTVDPNDAATIWLDSSETRERFDWRPTVKFEEGLKKTIEWYKASGVQQTYTHLRGN